MRRTPSIPRLSIFSPSRKKSCNRKKFLHVVGIRVLPPTQCAAHCHSFIASAARFVDEWSVVRWND
ncbi:unnamed protein product [Rhodiola kirilowii]